MLQPEGEIFGDGSMREQRELLEKQTDAAQTRRHVDFAVRIEQDAATESNASAVGAFEAGDAAQQHRLARARWPENGERRVVFRSEGDVECELGQLLFDLEFE